jgi:hypothetical protein
MQSLNQPSDEPAMNGKLRGGRKVFSLSAAIGICVSAILAERTLASGPVISTGNADSIAGTAIEQDYSPEEEHESNGPEGSAGVPMEHLPVVDLVFAGAVLLGTWRLCAAQAPRRGG